MSTPIQVLIGGDPDGSGGSPTNNTTTGYYPFYGGGGPIWRADRTYDTQLSSTAGTITSLYVYLEAAPGAGTSWTFTLYQNGSATNLSVIISDTNTANNDTTHSVTVAAGDQLIMSATPANSPAYSTIAPTWSALFTPTVSGETILPFSIQTFYDADYGQPIGPGNSDPTSGRRQAIIPCAGVIDKLYAAVKTAPGTGKGWQFTVRLNGTNQSLLCKIEDTNTTGNDLSDTVTVAAGDKIDIAFSISKGAPSQGTNYLYGGFRFVPSTPGNFIISARSLTISNATTTEYLTIAGGGDAWSPTESLRKQVSNAFTMKSIYVWQQTAPGAGTSYAFTLKQNGSATGLTVSLADTNTAANYSTNISISVTDLLGTVCVPTNTPATSRGAISYLGFRSDTGGGLTATLTDNITTSDTFTPFFQNWVATFQDNVTASDTLSTVIPVLKSSLTDNATVSDTLSAVIPVLLQSLVDNGTASDTLTARIILLQSLVDNITASDTFKKNIPVLLSSLVDNITASDTFSKVINKLLLSAIDNMTMADTFNPLVPVLLNSLVDNITAADTFTGSVTALTNLLISLTDAINSSDVFSPLIPTLYGSMTDNVTTADTLSPLIPQLLQSMVDNITANDTFSPLITVLVQALTDAISMSDTLSGILPQLLQNLSDNITVSDSFSGATLVLLLIQSFVDNITVLDTITENTAYPPNGTYFVVSSTNPGVLDWYVNNVFVGRMTIV